MQKHEQYIFLAVFPFDLCMFFLYILSKSALFPSKTLRKRTVCFYPPSLLGKQALACCHGFKSILSGIFFRILGHFQCLMIGFFCSVILKYLILFRVHNLPYDSIRTIREKWFNVLMYVNHIGQDDNNIPQQNARKRVEKTFANCIILILMQYRTIFSKQ